MPDQNEIFHDHVQQAASLVYPGDVVTRWIVVAETMDNDGVRALITAAQPGAKAWDSLGLLTYALQMEQAEAVRDDQ